MSAASVATEYQGGCQGLRARLDLGFAKRHAEVLVCRMCVANMQPERLSNPHLLTDIDGAGVGIATVDAAHEEIATTIFRLVFVDDNACQERLPKQVPLVMRQRIDYMCDLVEGVRPRELRDNGTAAGGDDHVGADRRAPL